MISGNWPIISATPTAAGIFAANASNRVATANAWINATRMKYGATLLGDSPGRSRMPSRYNNPVRVDPTGS